MQVDPRRDFLSRKVLHVVRDDRAHACHDRSGDNVFVIRVWEAVAAVKALPAVYFSIVESATHRANEPRGPFLSLGDLEAVTLNELPGFVVFELGEDGRAPYGPIDTLDSEGQQHVSLEARPQHTGIEKRSKHLRSLSDAVSSSSSLSDFASCFT